MDTLEGKKIISRMGKLVLADKALRDSKLILFVFYANWCEQSHIFLKKLKRFSEELQRRKLNLYVQIVSVSSDLKKEEMMEHFLKEHGDWFSLQFEDPLAEELRLRYGVTSIPMLVVLKHDGTEVTRTGRKDIEEKGINSLVVWTS